MQQDSVDWRKANKRQLLAALDVAMKNTAKLSDTIARLMNRPPQSAAIRPGGHKDDFVPSGWSEQHGISIPRADGVFESPTAWVRLSRGVITGAGLKNQSILSMMISLRLVDEGEERSARLYVDWKAAFLSSVDPVKWTPENGRGDPEAWSKEDRYSKLLHRVDQDCLFAMDAMVAEKPKAKHLAAFRNNQPKFTHAMGVVVGSIREINREAEDALKKCAKNQ